MRRILQMIKRPHTADEKVISNLADKVFLSPLKFKPIKFIDTDSEPDEAIKVSLK